MPWFNDMHSRLNRTFMSRVIQPRTVQTIQKAVLRTAQKKRRIVASGARHAMGGQQFLLDGDLLDLRRMKRVLEFDAKQGVIQVEAGMQWPDLIQWLRTSSRNKKAPWGIVQKQTGADRLTLGGALSANIHGRQLRRPPIVSDVEAFDLVDPQGRLRHCSRTENKDLFSLAIGGYGLFGVITSVHLRLNRRQTLQRDVELSDVDQLPALFEQRLRAGYVYGDFQYATDATSPDFLKKGVFSCYKPVDVVHKTPKRQHSLSTQEWIRLYAMGHTDKRRAFELYSQFYLSTQGQFYESDTHQLSFYPERYHQSVDRLLHTGVPGSDMISEMYVPRRSLPLFMEKVRDDFRRHRVNVFYGTIRLIEKDSETFLPWARKAWACVIFNIHTAHVPAAVAKTAEDCRRLIDRALALGGSYYLTYHPWASRGQIRAAYPTWDKFVQAKQKHDPESLFTSDWFERYR
jgi:FAD/FMN-containing dehydrogenase